MTRRQICSVVRADAFKIGDHLKDNREYYESPDRRWSEILLKVSQEVGIPSASLSKNVIRNIAKDVNPPVVLNVRITRSRSRRSHGPRSRASRARADRAIKRLAHNLGESPAAILALFSDDPHPADALYVPGAMPDPNDLQPRAQPAPVEPATAPAPLTVQNGSPRASIPVSQAVRTHTHILPPSHGH